MSFVHRFIPGTGEDPRTAIVFHGTGGDENSLVPFAQSLMPGAAILSLRGRVDENGMPRFFRRFAEGVFDYDSIRDESDAVAAFLSQASQDYGCDLTTAVGIGYSNGANIAWSTLLRHPESFGTLVLFRPMVTLDEHADLKGKRIFVGTAEHDPIVPVENVERLIEQMKSCGASVEVSWHPGGHQLTRGEITLASSWLGMA